MQLCHRRDGNDGALCVRAGSQPDGLSSSRAVKFTLREMICRKLLRLRAACPEKALASELVQAAVEEAAGDIQITQ